MAVGDQIASEQRVFTDVDSGATVRQLTDYRAHSHHFYFTNPGWYAGGERLLVSSDRGNATNLYGIELSSGTITQLTDLEPLPLPREVEFLRACLNPTRDEVYYWYGMELVALDLERLATRVLFRLEDGWDVSMINCSADGAFIYASVSEDLSDRIRVDYLRGYVGFRETWAARPLSRIVQVATDGSGGRAVHEERYWIGHVNTSPAHANILTFCHEGPWDQVDQRIWGFDTERREAWKIRARRDGETVGHEYWFADGERVGYHGANADGSAYLGHCRYDDTDHVEHSFPGRTGHIHSNDAAQIVGDGGDVVRLWQWDGARYEGPRVLCRHDSSMKIQQLHVHPRFTPSGNQVVFTSDVSGYGNVYLVDVPELASLPSTAD